MADTARDIFITGLRNAHAMERQALEMMERQAERLTDYPEVRQRADQHRAETEQQIQRLEAMLGDLGESHSALKDFAMSSMGNIAAMGHAMAGDEILKNTFANFAFEHYEIAAYTSLIEMARSAGVGNIEPLERTLDEERRMARWIAQHIPSITDEYLAHEEADSDSADSAAAHPS